jgi:pantetheine-phosphate adenylyltransferase
LIDKAFDLAGEEGTVFIGVTKGEMLKEKKFVKPFNKRIQSIKKYLLKNGYNKRAIIKSITDKYSQAVDGEFDAIIVSPETIENAEEINKKRLNKGKKPLKIVKIPYVLAEDNRPISSTRILKNEIDENGNKVN